MPTLPHLCQSGKEVVREIVKAYAPEAPWRTARADNSASVRQRWTLTCQAFRLVCVSTLISTSIWLWQTEGRS
jgi:methionyl-tRNA synthetase